MQKNRSNRPKKDLPPTQGYKSWETGETHAPLNNHQPRVGIAKWKRRRKCCCSYCLNRIRIAKEKLNKLVNKEWHKEIDN